MSCIYFSGVSVLLFHSSRADSPITRLPPLPKPFFRRYDTQVHRHLCVAVYFSFVVCVLVCLVTWTMRIVW